MFIVALIFLMIGLVGCGDDDDNDSSSDDSSTSDDSGTSGDDGSSNLNDLLDGAYALFTITNDEYNQENEVDFDGEGGLSATLVYDSSGDTGDTFSGTYTVETTAEATIDDTDSVGIVAADGGSFSLIDTILSGGVDEELMLGIGVKETSGMTDASVNGDYVFCQIRQNIDNTSGDYLNAAASYYELTMNGDGTYDGDTTFDSDGGTGTDTLSGKYTVYDDGGIDVTVDSTSKDLQGRVSADGNLIVLLDEETPDDNEILIMVGLKKTTGADASLLSGDYQLNTLGIDQTGGGAWASRVDATADGVDTIDADIIADSDDDTGTVSINYTVDANGGLTLTTTSEHGIVSSDGEIFIIVDTNETADGDVLLGIGFKKS